MPTFNLHHLKYFHDTIRLGGVSQAALENHVSQSAVSQGIAKLERCLGAELLLHRRNRIQLTDAGRAIMDRAATVLQAVDALETAVHSPAAEYSGEVVVACTHSLAQSVLLSVLHEFHRLAPKVQFKLRFGHAGLIKNWLRDGSIDFGLAVDNEDLSNYETELLYRGRFDFFHDASTSPPSLINKAIFSDPRHEVHAIKRSYQEKFNGELQTAMEMASWELIASFVMGTSHVGFFPDYLMLHPDRMGRLTRYDIGLPEVPYRLLSVKDKYLPLSRNSELFLDIVQKTLNLLH